MRIVWACVLLVGISNLCAADEPWQEFLTEPILAKDQTAQDVVAFVQSRLPALKVDATSGEWEKSAAKLRATILDRVVYRGEAARWRDAKCGVEWFDTIDGGPGYKLRKLRYEALPGLWIPAILYVPDQIQGRVPVALNVNGHDSKGKAADYKQLRCINLAKRGMLALNVEWLGMGQLRTPSYSHGRMNQLDLCGTSGLAPFYLAMKRGLDVLLALPEADPERVAVAGLSGGGWQTIFISALDTRVTLCNPVAGYSDYLTRLRHWKDLGDSEQTPLDLGTVADYSHLTALLAPRPALLTFNAKDNCCFESGYALPPLLEAARPVYSLFGKADFLDHHVNTDPGDHNFGKDNREAFYRILVTHFAKSDTNWTVTEIESADEVKTAEQLQVEMPEKNADFNTLALELAKQFPTPASPPSDSAQRDAWLKMQRAGLRQQVGYRAMTAEAKSVREMSGEGWKARAWQIQLGNDWQIPVVEITPASVERTQIVFADGGWSSLVKSIATLLAEKTRVLAVDPTYFDAAHISNRAYLFALMVNTVGERPIGVQSGQVAAVADWARSEFKSPVGLVTVGPRSSCVGLVAAAVEPEMVNSLQMQDAYDSLNVILEKNLSFDACPELFCAGLLATYDLPLIRQLITPGVLK